MDGENNGKPYFQMDDVGGENPLFLETSISKLEAHLTIEKDHVQYF